MDTRRRFAVEHVNTVTTETPIKPKEDAVDLPNISQVELLAYAKGEYANFQEKFGSVINAYYGTPDMKFTMKPGGWYVDYENLVVNADPNFFIERGYTVTESLFATFHEAEHFRDMARNSDAYDKFFSRIAHIGKTQKTYSKVLARLNNCLEDVVVNKSVMSRWKAGVKAKNTLYPKLFSSTVLDVNPNTNKPEPLHRQFMYALLRTAMLPNEPVQIAPKVQEAIDKIDGQKFIDWITSVSHSGTPDHDAAQRHMYYQVKIEPVFKELFDIDVEQKNDQDEDDNKDGEKGEKGEIDPNAEADPNAESDPNAETDPDAEADPNAKSEKSDSKDDLDDGDVDFGNDPFEDTIPDPIEMGDLSDVIDKLKEAAKNKKFEDNIGVKKEDFDRYRRDYDRVEKYIEELSAVFDQVISRRKQYTRVLRKQVKEGVMLNPSRVATAVAEIKSGNNDPRVMLDYEYRESMSNVPSEFEFTMVGDISGSMASGGKYIMQKRLMLLGAEALKLFSERVKKAKRKGNNVDLDVRSEIRCFGDNDHELKPLSDSLTQKERVSMHKVLGATTNQGNNELATFTEIRTTQFTPQLIEKIKKGDLKKVILFFTDGESSQETIQAEIQKLYNLVAVSDERNPNLVVAGLGFKGGSTAKETYKPNGYYAESFEEVVEIYKEFLTGMVDDL